MEEIALIASRLIESHRHGESYDGFLREVARICVNDGILPNPEGYKISELHRIFSDRQRIVLRELYDANKVRDIQPKPTPLPAGEQEVLISGRLGDTRLPLRFFENAARVARAIAMLAVPRIVRGVRDSDEPAAYGTGWLIAPNLVITNYHVIEARKPEEKEPHIRPDELQEQVKGLVLSFDYYEDPLIIEKSVQCQGAQLIHWSEQLDYAIFEILEADKVRLRDPLRIATQQPVLKLGTRLNIVQHADGHAMLFAVRNNFFVRIGPSEALLRYQTDTAPGASGSPVCDDHWCAIALHHASVRVPTETVPQESPEGSLASVSYLNEGISIHAILEDLPQGLKGRISQTS